MEPSSHTMYSEITTVLVQYSTTSSITSFLFTCKLQRALKYHVHSPTMSVVLLNVALPAAT